MDFLENGDAKAKYDTVSTVQYVPHRTNTCIMAMIGFLFIMISIRLVVAIVIDGFIMANLIDGKLQKL